MNGHDLARSQGTRELADVVRQFMYAINIQRCDK